MDLKKKDERPLNPNEVQLEVSFIKAEAVYSYDLYDEYGNVVLEAYVPFSDSLLKHLKKENVKYLIYDAKNRKVPDEGEWVNKKKLISESLHQVAYEGAREVLDYVRDLYNYSPGTGISRAKIEKSREMVNKILDEVEKNEDGFFKPLVKLKELDEYEYNHSTNVSILGALLATKLEYSREIRTAMGLGGLFHDLGKTSIAKDILHKVEQLSEEELDIVKEHPHIGYKLVEDNIFMHDLEKRIVLLHHERADGNGYPYGLDSEHYINKIPKEVRLMSLCDVYAALIAKRPYGEPYSSRDALRIMLNMLEAPYKKVYHFLPADFRDFIRALGLRIDSGNYFIGPGDLVRLNTGEVAVIEEMNRLYPLNPKIRVLTTRDKQPVKRQIQIDMLKNYTSYIANVYERKTEKKDTA
jgi:HD-GYP domain-containing protein (c-di-GMP phosphodiesterase class II)